VNLCSFVDFSCEGEDESDTDLNDAMNAVYHGLFILIFIMVQNNFNNSTLVETAA